MVPTVVLVALGIALIAAASVAVALVLRRRRMPRLRLHRPRLPDLRAPQLPRITLPRIEVPRAHIAWGELRERFVAPSKRSRPLASSSSAPPSLGSSAANGADPSGGREDYVRVWVRNGRCVEGWRRQGLSRDARVLLLDVAVVYDSHGNETPTTPLDSFLPVSLVDRVETLGEPASRRG
jgi:hypothetical protein